MMKIAGNSVIFYWLTAMPGRYGQVASCFPVPSRCWGCAVRAPLVREDEATPHLSAGLSPFKETSCAMSSQGIFLYGFICLQISLLQLDSGFGLSDDLRGR